VAEPSFRWSAITIDCERPDMVAPFWAGVLGGELSVPLPGWLRLTPPGGTLPALTFQPVPEPKSGKTRIHVDVAVDDIEAGIDAVQRLGGRPTRERHDYPEGVVVVMTDPEGTEFCLVQYFDA
jgi:predicted enzyme related to lactoylglutathione lyase